VRAGHVRLGPALGVIAGVAVVILLLDSVTWPGVQNPYDFFTYPAAVFYRRVLLERASLVHLPLIHPAPDRLVESGIAMLALAWILSGHWVRAVRPAAGMLAIGLVVGNMTQTLYVLRKYTEGAGGASGPDAAARSWVDRHVPGDAQVGALGISLGDTATYIPIWRETEFWNTSVEDDVFFGGPALLWLPMGSETVRLELQPVTGLLTAYWGTRPALPAKPPRYLLVPRQGTNQLGLETQLVAQDPYLPLDLVQLSTPAHVDWSLSGTSEEGFLAPGQPAIATIYSMALAGNARRCATFFLIAPPAFSGRWPYTASIARRTVRTGSLLAGQTAAVSVPLAARTAGARAAVETLTVRVHGHVRFVNGALVSAKLASFAVSRCPATGSGR
jgi:hypothetical protein